ncbi:hypothetical protein [Flavobacterium sp.]|uniref:hypothetical protein n=2 Tax=Flavobacterium sp. TaxID=239 RepID=UPI00404895D1
MIIKSNSFLRRPSTKIHPEQIIILNAIRYSVDICEMAFNRLEKNLYEFQEQYYDGKFMALIFSDVWTIINNGAILKKVICNNFNISNNDPIFGILSKLKGLRDTNQHIEERAFQSYNYPELPPIYGTISWYAKKKENDFEGILTTIYSGTIFRNINAEMENPAGKENPKIVNDIKFEGIERVGKSDFVKSTIYINNIIDDIKILIQNFEVQFENQFKDIDMSERHISDLIIQFKIKEIEQ